MIAKYPDFSPLSIEQQHEWNQAISGMLPYSDFNFASISSWDTGNDTMVSNLKGNLLVQFPDYITNEPIYIFLGSNEVSESIAQIFRDGIKALEMVPEETVIAITDKSLYHIRSDVNNFDYIYKIEDQSLLNGGKFSKKREAINHFQKLYGQEITLSTIDFQNEAHKTAVLNVFHDWKVSGARKDEDIQNEFRATTNLIKNADLFNLHAHLLLHDSKPIAFIISEKLDYHYAIGHFEKSNLRYKAANYVLRHFSMAELHKQGYKLINGEQDLGIEGLRASKLSYHPISFLKKYTITPK